MALTFTMIETTMTPLWDLGWFDLTRFKVDGPPSERQDGSGVLGEFLRLPISQRSFCDPGQWGEPVERHGPLLHRGLVADLFRPLSSEELGARIQLVLDDPQFTESPKAEQRESVEAWVAAVQARGDELFVLDSADQAGAQVDWAWVWIVYQEFASVSRDREELSIGVIGYD